MQSSNSDPAIFPSAELDNLLAQIRSIEDDLASANRNRLEGDQRLIDKFRSCNTR